MPVHRPFLATVCLAGSLGLSGCAGGAQNTGSLTAPTALTTAALVVQVDAICSGQESNIRVYIDLVPIGVTNPGDPGVSETVTIGEHQLSAVSQRGTMWGPFPTTVVASRNRSKRAWLAPAAKQQSSPHPAPEPKSS